MSIYKRGVDGGCTDPCEMTPLHYRIAQAHAASIVLSRESLGHDIHDFDNCPACDSHGEGFRAVVAHNSEVKTHACKS